MTSFSHFYVQKAQNTCLAQSGKAHLLRVINVPRAGKPSQPLTALECGFAGEVQKGHSTLRMLFTK
jgi:hypothetical protein